MVEHLPSMFKVLGSIPGIVKNKKQNKCYLEMSYLEFLFCKENNSLSTQQASQNLEYSKRQQSVSQGRKNL